MDSDHVDAIIERALAERDVPSPSAGFTAGVMARVVKERWRTERVVDFGFNLAVAVGVLFILAGGAGLAMSLGFLHITIDFETLVDLTRSRVAGSEVISQAQTVATAAVVLMFALGLWWWAEADSTI
jgi:hypothetical protein